MGLGWRRSLGGDGGHPLAHGEHVGLACGDVVEQGVQGSQALVAGADVVAAVVLEVAQEAEDPFEGQVLDAEPGDLGALVVCDEMQQEPYRVAIAAHRRPAQSLHGDQVVDEEGVQERPERPRPGHGCACTKVGAAKASNRRFASVSSWGVMVR
jgi:hypothetical protein